MAESLIYILLYVVIYIIVCHFVINSIYIQTTAPVIFHITNEVTLAATVYKNHLISINYILMTNNQLVCVVTQC